MVTKERKKNQSSMIDLESSSKTVGKEATERETTNERRKECDGAKAKSLG